LRVSTIVFTILLATYRSPITDFEWDEVKRAANLVKHGIDFIDIAPLFDGEIIEAIDRRLDYGELRIRCLGEILGRVYAVAYTWRGNSRRIISARKANERETRIYYARNL
jgi:uncharacterized DUF497 family protein